jgi:bifunctional DNA-binding transcriptional regulator/antitoxin component of YhaV-PrlF toxin-antitoxin module
VPKEIREHLKLKEGDTLIWVVGSLGTVYVKRGAVVEAVA